MSSPQLYQSYRPSQQTVVKKKRHQGRRFFVLCLIIIAFIATGFILKKYINPVAAIQAVVASTKTTKVAPLTTGQKEQAALQSAWKGTAASTSGDVAIAVYDHQTGMTASWSSINGTFDTASIIKLSILEATLINDQNNGSGLTADQLAVATPMIENSDNDSATTLWNQLGGASGITSFFNLIGATSTTADASGDWGLTHTTATDQLKVLNALAYPGGILSASSAQSADSLLDNVESDQAWGVSAGSPSDVTVELKNGWLEDDETNDPYQNTEDWTVNSIGHIHGENQDYTIAVLSQGNPTEQDGINKIENLATTTWQIIANKQY